MTRSPRKPIRAATDGALSAPPPLPVTTALADALLGGGADVWLEGVRGGALAKVLADLLRAAPASGPHVVLLAGPEAVEALASGLAAQGAERVFEYPAWDLLPPETDQPDPEIAAGRVGVLRALAGAARGVVVLAPVCALTQPVLSLAALRAGAFAVAPGSEASPGGVAARLVEAGLEAVAAVDAPGQFCRRGGLLDVWPLLAERPVRIEFFGDTVDTLRYFNPETQAGDAPVAGAVALIEIPRRAFRDAYAPSPAARHSLFNHIAAHPGACVWLAHPAALSRAAELYESGFDEGRGWLLPWARLAADAAARRWVVVPELDDEEWPATPWRAPRGEGPARLDAATRSVERFSGGLDTALGELSRWIAGGGRARVWCQNAAEQKRLAELFAHRAGELPRPPELAEGRIGRGFAWGGVDDGWVLLADHEIFGRSAARRPPAARRATAAPLGDFGQLRDGDYVVHVACGVARFEGLRKLEKDGSEQDYLCLKFADDARLYVPLSQVDLVQRYVGSTEAPPALSRLGGGQWERRKAAVARAVRDIAQDLLATQAARNLLPGFACPETDEFVDEFSASFPYDETPDQLSALEDIKNDQISPRPMDRLLCGDVGFGKTEVALRACYRVVAAGRQAAVLVPTTVLAEQHYRTFRERLAGFPANVACLSRFRTPEEQRRIVESAKDGRVDIVVGTHRLLSKDVAFRDLGLVVVDEEQRFGVEHKERLKGMKASVDVLTMTATPIPRTLHLSLLGLRDISNLTTPPAERHAVRTLVAKWSDELVRRAILRELARGGQVFFLHNRVKTIDTLAAKLLALIPEARFGIGHGQMAEGELLRVMTRFLDRKFDVLVCTTIVESGVDIPNVNTLIVDDADHFGLSELHQLRGRVGRREHQAYAYFLVPAKRPVTEVARKRLQALREYSELGAGFRLAMRDLEIRGAGNLLGAEQSGHIGLVGFDLYCRLLERTVAELQGRDPDKEPPPVELELGTRAFVPTEYIPVDTQRIEFYRKLVAARDPSALTRYADYVRERYGPPPPEVARCFADQRLRLFAAAAGVSRAGRMAGALAMLFTAGDDGATSAPATPGGVVARLRRAGRRVTPLENNRWRVELSASEDADTDTRVAAFEKILTVLANAASAGSAASFSEPRPKIRKTARGAVRETAVAASLCPSPVVKTPEAVPPTPLPFSPPPFVPPPTPLSASVEPPTVSPRELPAEAPPPEAKRERLDFVYTGASGSGDATAHRSYQKKRRSRELTMLTSSTVFGGGGGGVGSAGASAPSKVSEGPGTKVLGLEPRADRGVVVAMVAADELPEMPFGPVTLWLGADGSGARRVLRCRGSDVAPRGRWALLLSVGGADEVEALMAAFLAAGGARLSGGVSV